MSEAGLTRRIVLNAGLLTAAGFALASCGPHDAHTLERTTDPKFGYFTPDQSALLLDVADIMIPSTDTAGAADSETILYLDQLMQNWASQATKLQINRFVDKLNAKALDGHRSAYLDLPKDIRRAVLQEIDAESFGAPADNNDAATYRRVKWLIFHIHHSSEAANPDFVLIPGQYRGDISESDYLALVEDNRY